MTIRVGFFGGGLIAGYHARGLTMAAQPGGTTPVDAAIVAVHDPDPDKAAQFAATTGAAVVATEDELIDAADAVYVCTWTAEHPRLVVAAAAAGKAVFCEKPLAVNAAVAAQMVHRVQAAGVVNQVGLVLRDAPVFAYLRHALADPANGAVLGVVFRDDQYLPVQGMYGSTWRGDATKAGAGTLLEHSIHDLDLLEWLLGPITEVNARAAERHGIAGIEDVVSATLLFESDAIASLTSVWHDLLARPSLRRVEVLCEQAHFWLEDDRWGPLHWTRGDEQGAHGRDELRELLARAGIALRNPDAAFIAAVAAGQPASPTLADALSAHIVADAIYASASAAGAPVAIARPPAQP